MDSSVVTAVVAMTLGVAFDNYFDNFPFLGLSTQHMSVYAAMFMKGYSGETWKYFKMYLIYMYLYINM